MAARTTRGHRAPIGRGRGIRTLDVQLPKLALYQAELYPVASNVTSKSTAECAKKNTKIAGLRTIHHAGNLPLYPSHHRAIYRKRKGCRSTLRGSGAPGEIRTPDHQVRSLVLYPAELRARRSGIIPSPVILVNPKSTSRETNRVAGRLAEREGFEPSIEFLTLYSLSRGAPSASRAPLRYLKPEPLFVPEAYSARHPVSPSVFTGNALQRIAQTLKPRPLGHLSDI